MPKLLAEVERFVGFEVEGVQPVVTCWLLCVCVCECCCYLLDTCLSAFGVVLQFCVCVCVWLVEFVVGKNLYIVL